jgi:hypothetical protein
LQAKFVSQSEIKNRYLSKMSQKLRFFWRNNDGVMGNHGLGTQWQNVCWKFDWKYPKNPKSIQPICPNQQIIWNIFEKSPRHMCIVHDLGRWFWETLKNQLFVLFWNFSHFWDLSAPSKTTLTCFWLFSNYFPTLTSSNL